MRRFNLKMTGLESKSEKNFHFNLLHKFSIDEIPADTICSSVIPTIRLLKLEQMYSPMCFCEKQTECILLPPKKRTILDHGFSSFLNWPPILFIKSPTISCNLMPSLPTRNIIYMFFLERYVNSLEEIVYLYKPPFCFGKSGQMCLNAEHDFYFNEKPLLELINHTLMTPMRIYSPDIFDLWDTHEYYPFVRTRAYGVRPLTHLGISAELRL